MILLRFVDFVKKIGGVDSQGGQYERAKQSRMRIWVSLVSGVSRVGYCEDRFVGVVSSCFVNRALASFTTSAE